MTAPPPPPADGVSGARSVGPIAVSADAGDVARFAAALGLEPDAGGGRRVPATYPIRWLLLPAVRDLLAGATPARGALVHEAQDIAYRAALEPGGRYRMSASIEPAGDPSRLVVTGRIVDDSGALVCTLTSRLRLVERMPGVAP
jgi:hypothetical protein